MSNSFFCYFYIGHCHFNLQENNKACKAWKKSIDLGLLNTRKNELVGFCEQLDAPLPADDSPREFVAIESTLYLKRTDFKDGVYNTYEEFKFNSPSISYLKKEDVMKDGLNLQIEKKKSNCLF